MKHPFRFSILPFFTMGTGGLGLILRFWLFSATDEKGLLPAAHPADTLLFVLAALVLGILFFATRTPTPAPCRRRTLRCMYSAAYALAAAGMLLAYFTDLTGGRASLGGIASICCIINAALLLVMAFLNWTGKSLPYVLPTVFAAALMLITIALCQVWGTEPQMQVYFFPLMASVFSILTAYQATATTAGQGNRPLLAFFSQSALFFCCLSLNAHQWPLYAALGFWSAAQLIPCYPNKKES